MLLFSVVPSPSWPLPFLPQQYASPAVVTPHVKSPPAMTRKNILNKAPWKKHHLEKAPTGKSTGSWQPHIRWTFAYVDSCTGNWSHTPSLGCGATPSYVPLIWQATPLPTPLAFSSLLAFSSGAFSTGVGGSNDTEQIPAATTLSKSPPRRFSFAGSPVVASVGSGRIY